MINYAIANNRIAHDYLVNYTNAAFIIKDGFKLPDDGLYSGFDPEKKVYDKSTWNYEEGGDLTGKPVMPTPTSQHVLRRTLQAATKSGTPKRKDKDIKAASPAGAKGGAAAPAMLPPKTAFDLSLQHPRCVFQLLKQQYSRYTPEMVERITGIPKDQFLKAADMFTSVRKDGDMKKVATIIYAVGWTQHSFGTQIIRTAAMLQLMMGNVGRAGGGVNALRGHSNIQGATDMAGIFDILPGYLKMPNPADTDLATYLKRTTPTAAKPDPWESLNYWSNTPKFAVSFLKAMYGPAATKENDFAFNYLPKIDRNYSWVNIWNDMYEGKVKGIFAFGMNGVMIGPDSEKNIDALKKADWLVVCEIYPDETSEFWRAPGITADDQKKINTTVYRLPGAGFAEKDGTFVNSARWLQWKHIAVPPPGLARLDQEILATIFLKVRELYKKEGGKFPDPVLNATFAYTTPYNPSLAEVAKEINGKALADLTDPKTNVTIKAGQQLPGFALAQRRRHNFLRKLDLLRLMDRSGWHDPAPRNRRSVRPRHLSQLGDGRGRRIAACSTTAPRAMSNGKPWDPSRRQVWWDEAKQSWVGNDVPDFKPDSAPKDHMGPFIMNPEGVGRLFVPLGAMADGPFPEYYEPIESPIANLLHPNQSNNPVVKKYKTDMDKYGTVEQGFNVICTTYRLTEHYHYWTKNNPMNVELVPEPFVEVPHELADQMGIRGGEKVKVTSARSHYIAKAMVTRRIRPMKIDGKETFQIGIPIHWGFRGIAEDEGRTAKTLANQLTPTVIDPNAFTPEFKGFLVKIKKV